MCKRFTSVSFAGRILEPSEDLICSIQMGSCPYIFFAIKIDFFYISTNKSISTIANSHNNLDEKIFVYIFINSITKLINFDPKLSKVINCKINKKLNNFLIFKITIHFLRTCGKISFFFDRI